MLRGHRWTRLGVPIVAVEPALSPRGRACVPLVPSTPHILLESAVCSLNPCRPPQRVNPSHYTVNTVQNRWQLGWMGPQRAQELLGASQSLCCPGRMPGHLAQGYIPGTCWGQASARTCGQHSVWGPLPPGCMAKCSQPWHQCPPLGYGTPRCGWHGRVPINHSFRCFNLVWYRAVHILGL